MDYTTAEYAQVLAARFWFNKNNIKIETIANYWEISEDDVCDILRSQEYRLEVEKLMRISQSPSNLLKWIKSSVHAKPPSLAKRMRLPVVVVSEMIDRIEQDIHTRWNIRH